MKPLSLSSELFIFLWSLQHFHPTTCKRTRGSISFTRIKQLSKRMAILKPKPRRQLLRQERSSLVAKRNLIWKHLWQERLFNTSPGQEYQTSRIGKVINKSNYFKSGVKINCVNDKFRWGISKVLQWFSLPFFFSFPTGKWVMPGTQRNNSKKIFY